MTSWQGYSLLFVAGVNPDDAGCSLQSLGGLEIHTGTEIVLG
jgi:hypothetical protein